MLRNMFEPILHAMRLVRRLDLAFILVVSLLVTTPTDGKFFDSRHLVGLPTAALFLILLYGLVLIFQRQRTLSYFSLKNLLPSLCAFGAAFAFCFLVFIASQSDLDLLFGLAAFAVFAPFLAFSCAIVVWFFPWITRNRWR